MRWKLFERGMIMRQGKRQPVLLDDKLHQRLENWGDWWRAAPCDGPGPARCASAEGHYRAPRDQTQEQFEQARNPWKALIDEHDAAFVDRVIQAPWFPMKERAFLVGRYCHQLKPSALRDLLRLRARDVDKFHARALAITRNRLDIAESRRQTPISQSDAASRVPAACFEGTRGGRATSDSEHPKALAA